MFGKQELFSNKCIFMEARGSPGTLKKDARGSPRHVRPSELSFPTSVYRASTGSAGRRCKMPSMNSTCVDQAIAVSQARNFSPCFL